MAYNVKYECTHKVLAGDNTTVTYLIEILEDGFGGSSTEVNGMGEVFRLDYNKTDDRNPFENPIQKGRLEFYLAVEDSSDLSILTDIVNNDETQFQLRLSKDGSIVWTGYVLNDLTSYSEDDYPFPGIIVAKDLTRLSGIDFPLTDDRVTLITTLADFLDDLNLGLDIYTYTSWTESNLDSSITGDYDFLNNIYNERKGFRDFAQSGEEADQSITVEDALKRFLVNYGIILRQVDNAWRVYQITAFDTPTSVFEARYDSTGSQLSTSTVDLTADIDRTNRYILPSSTTNLNPAIKEARVKFDHRSKVSNIVVPNTFELDSGTTTEQFSQFFLSDGSQVIELSGKIEGYFAAGGFDDVTVDIEIKISRPSDPDYYWDGSTWSTTADTVTVNLVNRGRVDANGNTGHFGGFDSDTTTNATPADADGTLEITFFRADSATAGGFADRTLYRNVRFDILNATATENSKSIDYRLTQSGDYSTLLELDDTNFGDGPTGYAVSALRYGSSDSETTNDSWQRRGTTTNYRNFHEQLLKEIIDTQRTATRVISAELYGDYDATDLIDYDSATFFFLGGFLSGNPHRWNATFLVINIQTGSDTFEDIPKFTDETGSGTTGGGAGSSGGLDQSTADNRYLLEANNLSDLDSDSTARTNLGVAIGTDVQAWDDDLDDIAALTPSDSNFIVGDGTDWVTESGNTARASLGLTNASADLDLNSIDINGSAFVDSSRNVSANSLTVNSQSLFTLGNEQLLSTDASPTFAGLTSTGQVDIGISSVSDSYLRIRRDDDTVVTSSSIIAGNHEAGVYIDNLSTVADMGSPITWRGRGTGTAFASIAATFPSANNSFLRFYTEDGGTFAENAQLRNGQWNTKASYVGGLNTDVTSGSVLTVGGTADIKDSLFVEGGLFAKEFTVDTTRVFLSSRFGSGGVVGEIVDSTVGSEQIKFVDQDGNEIVPFADNDLLLIQERTGVNSGTIVKRIKRKVVADSQPSNVVSLTTTGVTTGSDVGTIAVGDQAVLDGNTTDTDRDSFIAVDVLDRDIAAFGFIDNQTDFGNGTEVMRVGGMEPGGANEYDSSLTGDVGIAGKIGGNLAFALTEDEGLIGGINFDNAKLWTGDGTNGYVGLGATNGATDRAFWAGSANTDGSGVTSFYVQQNGKIFYDGIGKIIYSQTNIASFNNNGSTPDSLTNDVWQTQTSSVGTNANSTEEVKIRTRFIKRFGEDNLILDGWADQDITADETATHESRIYIRIFDSSGVEQVTDFISDSSFTPFFTQTVDISTLTDDAYYVVEISCWAQVDGDDGNTVGANQSTTTELREDIFVFTTD